MTKKRFISMLFAVALTMGLVPAMASAADPISTDLVIHKMQVETGTALEDHDGKEITDPTGTNLEDATPLSGIIFKYWTISPSATPAQMAQIQGLSTIEAIDAFITANPGILTGGTETAASNAQGIVNVNGLAEGKYLFAEINGASENVSEYIGVPFLLELPQMKTDGTGYFGTGADALHVYPKNVKKMPGLDVESVDADTSARIGSTDFLVQKWNDSTSAYETVTGIGTGGTITLPSGFVQLGDLPAGKYQLVNTEAPTGYVIDNRPVGFTVSAGVVTFDSPNSPMASFTHATGSDNPLITVKFTKKAEVGKTEENGGTERVGELVTWKVALDVPTLIKDYVKFDMTDTIDTRLDYVADSVVAKVGSTTLGSTHYTASYDDATRVLTVAFTPAALEAFEGEQIIVTYNTKINETAVMGEEIPNNVELSFNNGHGHITEPGEVTPPVTPTVWTGGAKFKKVDGSNTTVPLPGAEFKIASDASGTTFLTWTQDLLDANDPSKFVSPTVGGDIVMVSGTDGVFEIKGLKGGTYYLVETKAPTVGGTQYNLLRDPAPFTITQTSYEDTSTMSVENNSGLQIPQTGGMGTILFTIVGIALMGAAIVLFRKKRGAASAE
ncbi:SpaH/EbpB family LPXTG-anchored major pilin [Raoultibacter phocaeensis]|uniref:SpaH/EbpB family LPXTG-anchored major pilin n=1 Tax=Raoultibacter phocaeensis TaxID=2479841 RepID=UPI001117C104|nr:SpaH/EbpB family LPXTG-anchored major pilin [Raoultibacter phocaeensis]